MMNTTFQKLVATILVFIFTTSFLFCQYETPKVRRRYWMFFVEEESVPDMSYTVPADSTARLYAEGMRDGELEAKGNPVYGCGGFACGILGFVAAALSDPRPNPQLMVQIEESKGKDYAVGYQLAYSKKAKNQNMIFAGAGWLIGAAVSLAILANAEPAEEDKK